MKKNVLYLLCFMMAVASASAQNYNLTLRDQLTYTGQLSNIGGIAVNGNEYALVGWEFGLSIVDVTDPDSVFQVINIPGAQSIWREVKTHGNYAYVTTEASGDGLIIVDLNNLPASAPYTNYFGDGAIAGQLNTIHALHIEDGYVYLWGSNLFDGCGIICDLNADPWNPVYVGNTQGADPNYIHDGYIRDNLLYGGHIYNGYFSIMDVSNKANPVLLNTQETPNKFTHNCWLNDSGNVLFTTDEKNNTYLAAYDVSDPQNIIFLDKYQVDPGSQAVVHNTHTINDYEVVSWYKSGVVVVDVARPDNMVETGRFDTSPLSGGGFEGCWGVFPYLPSGNIVASDMQEGLFVLTPNYVRGCYLEGAVSDSVSNVTLGGVEVEILLTGKIKFSNIQGLYKTGLATAGTYDVKFSKAGYYDKTISGVQLQNGVVTTLDVELVPLIPIAFSGNVYNANTNLPVANAEVLITGTNGTFTSNTDATGTFTINSFFGGTYDITVGKWGYVTNCQNVSITGGTISIPLTPGIYDDFTFDFSWIASGTASSGEWERAEPVGTTNGNFQSNPEYDVTGDCTDKAYITGNGGGSAGDDDVDNGYTLLQSPFFNLSSYTNPVLNYSRWFYNAQAQNGPNDTLYVRISNGSVTVNAEIVTALTNGLGTWVSKSIAITPLLSLSPSMQVSLYISDKQTSGNVCEGGFDHFFISEGFTSVNELTSPALLQAYPNPFSGNTTVMYEVRSPKAARLEVRNALGQLVESHPLLAAAGTIQFGNDLQAGFYMVQLIEVSQTTAVLKVVKN